MPHCSLRCGQYLLCYNSSNNRRLMPSFTAIYREQVDGELLWHKVRPLHLILLLVMHHL